MTEDAPVGLWMAERKRRGLPYDTTDCERARTLHEVSDLLDLVLDASPCGGGRGSLFGVPVSEDQGRRAAALLAEGALWGACIETARRARAARA